MDKVWGGLILEFTFENKSWNPCVSPQTSCTTNILEIHPFQWLSHNGPVNRV